MDIGEAIKAMAGNNETCIVRFAVKDGVVFIRAYTTELHLKHALECEARADIEGAPECTCIPLPLFAMGQTHSDYNIKASVIQSLMSLAKRVGLLANV